MGFGVTKTLSTLHAETLRPPHSSPQPPPQGGGAPAGLPTDNPGTNLFFKKNPLWLDGCIQRVKDLHCKYSESLALKPTRRGRPGRPQEGLEEGDGLRGVALVVLRGVRAAEALHLGGQAGAWGGGGPRSHQPRNAEAAHAVPQARGREQRKTKNPAAAPFDETSTCESGLV